MVGFAKWVHSMQDYVTKMSMMKTKQISPKPELRTPNVDWSGDIKVE